MMVVSCSELATAFKVPTDLQNKCKQSVLRTMNQVNEKARNGQACELLTKETWISQMPQFFWH